MIVAEREDVGLADAQRRQRGPPPRRAGRCGRAKGWRCDCALYELRRTRRGIPALPFCHVTLRGQKPKPQGYPSELRTLGDHLRKRRMDLGLFQKDIAKRLGASTASVNNWELNEREPELRFIPGILRFLGYDPRPEPTTLGERICAAQEPGTDAEGTRCPAQPRSEYGRRLGGRRRAPAVGVDAGAFRGVPSGGVGVPYAHFSSGGSA